MHTYSRKAVLATGIALAMTTVNGLAATDTISQNVTEARQEAQIWTTYALSPYLRANDLKVSVHDGKATLTGKVEEDVNKDLAKQIALGVDGIQEVDNQIMVEADYVPASSTSSRNYNEKVTDTTISASIKSKLAWSKHTDGLSITVNTQQGKVKLQGSVDNAATKDFAGHLAMNTHGVISVDNQLQIDSSKSNRNSSYAKETGNDIADGWITMKVKSTFMYSSNVDSSDIAVSTNSGIVTLSGKVSSGAQRALAIELAQNIRGVKSVNSKALTI
jgi:hyperosmotically inducible protein